MVCIDPPYNTGNDFIYNDNFTVDKAIYDEASGQKDVEGGRLVANSDSNGRYHSDWLSMIYPRLKLSRNLLADDGAIVIFIDDNELANLKKICDEVFGSENFVAQVEWQKRYTRSNNTDNFTSVIDHVLIYAKSTHFQVNLLERNEEANARFTNPDDDHRGPWKATPFLNQVSPDKRPNLCYPIENPFTHTVANPTTKAWRYEESVFLKLLEENRLWWGKSNDKKVPDIKTFLSEVRSGMTPINFWEHKYAGNTDEANREIKALFDEKIFDTPKPTKLIRRAIEHICDENSIILDFFAGSGTSAHAVIHKNSEDNGGRKFILVQLPELVTAGSVPDKASYSNIAEISKERIRRAGKKIKEELAEKESAATTSLLGSDENKSKKLDIGFRVFKIDSSNMQDVHLSPDETRPDMLAALEGNIKADRTGEDLLFQVLLDWGVDLSLPIEIQTIDGKEVFFVDDNALAACFDEGINEDFVKLLAAKQPLRVVFRDDGFASDSVKINVEQIFKLKSPSTDIRVI